MPNNNDAKIVSIDIVDKKKLPTQNDEEPYFLHNPNSFI